MKPLWQTFCIILLLLYQRILQQTIFVSPLGTEIRIYNTGHIINRGYNTVARRYEFYFRVAKHYFLRTSAVSEQNIVFVMRK